MTSTTTLTILHQELQAEMVEFAGFLMPLHYTLGILNEHSWVREHAGLFDVSHMGQMLITGDAAAEFLSHITPTDFTRIAEGKATYTLLMTDEGGIKDDVIITRFDTTSFFMVYNAGRRHEDEAYIQDNCPGNVTCELLRDRAILALQGPEASAVLCEVLQDTSLEDLPYMHVIKTVFRDNEIWVSRLGYTGEDGYELSVPSDVVADLWMLFQSNERVEPVGLGARDSLRLDMGYPLYGHDIDDTTSPLEASLGWVISKGHEGFKGYSRIARERDTTVTRKRVGIIVQERGIAREGTEIVSLDGQVIGVLTSGGFSPTLKQSIGQGYVDIAYAKKGQELGVNIRGKIVKAMVQNLAFVEARTMGKK